VKKSKNLYIVFAGVDPIGVFLANCDIKEAPDIIPMSSISPVKY